MVSSILDAHSFMATVHVPAFQCHASLYLILPWLIGYVLVTATRATLGPDALRYAAPTNKRPRPSLNILFDRTPDSTSSL